MLVTAVWLKVMTKSWQKCNDFSSTKTMNVTKTIKHFHLKINTKTKSKMPAKINTVPNNDMTWSNRGAH